MLLHTCKTDISMYMQYSSFEKLIVNVCDHGNWSKSIGLEGIKMTDMDFDCTINISKDCINFQGK